MAIHYESYRDIVASVKSAPTQENIDALGEWFSAYGREYWNGENYNAGDLGDLYPIYDEHFDENGELDYADIVGYDLK